MQNRLTVPTGMQDTLPGECARKRELERDLRALFGGSGYQEIETPILEYYRALDDRTYGYRPEHVWKTFDAHGQILALRPESTIPAVRLAAGRLREAPLPLRLCYVQSATAFESETVSLLCEETQAGIELMGVPGPEADAEVIALAVESLRRAGLRDFQIELGQAGFLSAFLRAAGLDSAQAAQVRDLVERKDLIALKRALSDWRIAPEIARPMLRIPELYGGVELLDEAASLTKDPGCLAALENLRAAIRLLGVYGCADVLSIDLGLVNRAGYYSGILFRGQTGDLGQPILSGGRYDGLPERFGRRIPATGFAASLKLMLIALERQNAAAFRSTVPDVLLGFTPECLEQAIRRAGELREAGKRTAIAYGADHAELRRRLQAGECRSLLWLSADGEEAETDA